MAQVLTLKQYKDALDEAGLLKECINEDGFGKEISFVTYDSREVTDGTLFICKGAAFKPEYLKSAIADGACAYISETGYEEGGDVPAIIVSDIRKAMPILGDLFYDYPQKKLNLTGFGGTKGKSTSTYYMKYVVDEYLEKNGKPESGVLSSIDNYDGVIREESHITTAESLELHRHFYNAVSTGIDFMEMEVSSQALKYDRVLGIGFTVSVFLNISEDHISPNEHKDFEDYLIKEGFKEFRKYGWCDRGSFYVNVNSLRYSAGVYKAAPLTETIVGESIKNPLTIDEFKTIWIILKKHIGNLNSTNKIEKAAQHFL